MTTLDPVPVAEQAASLLRELRSAGVDTRVVDQSLKLTAPRGTLTPELCERIRVHKQALMGLLEEPRVQRGPRCTPAPASFIQEGAWLLHQLAPQSAVDSLRFAWRLRGALDLGALEWSLNQLLCRHDILRTTFQQRGEDLVQTAAVHEARILPVRDVSAYADVESELRRVIGEWLETAFDLERGPLFRPLAIRCADEEHVLLFCVSHTVFDGWSADLLWEELRELYRARREGSAPELEADPPQYADYARWQRALYGSGTQTEVENAWLARLAGLPLVELPTDRPRPERPRFRGARHELELPSAWVSGLRELASAERCTFFMVAQALFNLLLAAHSGQGDIVVGSAFANREAQGAPELGHTIGLVANAIALRTDLSGAPTFRELLRRVRGVTIEAIEHQHFPLTLLGRKLARVPGADPLPPGALLRFFFGTVPAKPSGSFAGIEFEELDVGTRHCAFDLELTLIESKAGARARFEYDRDLFDAQTVATIGRRFAVLGASAAAHPDTVIWSLAPLPEDGLPAPSRMSATPAARRSKAESKLPGHRGRIGEPVTPTEEWVAGIWRDLFGLQSPRPSDDFFALGGHSLLIGGLLRRARDYNGAELSFNDVFEASTIEALAARIDRGASRRSEPAHPTLRLKPVPRNGLLQASYSQQRFWFIDLMAGGGGAINLNLALGLRGALDRAALHAGLIEIVKRHEVLRTTFVLEGGRLFQRAGPAPDFDLEPIDVSGARHHEAAVAEHVARCLAIAFDMERGPLFRFTLLAHSEIQHTLLLTLHHAISDNDSFGVMFKELSELYLARIQGRQPALPRLRAQFADFAVLQREAFEESSGKLMEFWKRELQGLAPLELKPDRPRPEQRTFAGARAHFVVPADLAQALRALAAEESCTLFMTILTGFQLFAARVSGQRHFAIGLPVAGRSTPDAESLSGPFLNSLVLRADVSGQPTFRELLRRVRARTIAALEHQEMPFERLVKELAPDRDPHRNPLFQVLFNFLQELDPPDLGELEVEILHQEIWHTVLDLSLLMADTGSGLFGSIEFNSDMFDLETVNTWCRSLLEVLRAAANDPDAPTS